MKKIFINKIGLEHSLEWKNCQDYGFIDEDTKCVVDGCSEGDNSDIGARLFVHLFKKNKNITDTFEKLMELYPEFEEIKHHLLFTILFVTEDDDNFYTHVAGDGIIIKENHDSTFEYEIIEQDNSPAYYAYNYVPNDYLKKYQDGVEFKTFTYSKLQYKNIGIATDGLKYLLDSPYKKDFEKFLAVRKENRIKLLLNKIHQQATLHLLQNKTFPEPVLLKDDITIAL